MTIPALKSTPAANGMATTLYPVAQMKFWIERLEKTLGYLAER
jgi:hypothetical protein